MIAMIIENILWPLLKKFLYFFRLKKLKEKSEVRIKRLNN